MAMVIMIIVPIFIFMVLILIFVFIVLAGTSCLAAVPHQFLEHLIKEGRLASSRG